jgi:hypothetical protein
MCPGTSTPRCLPPFFSCSASLGSDCSVHGRRPRTKPVAWPPSVAVRRPVRPRNPLPDYPGFFLYACHSDYGDDGDVVVLAERAVCVYYLVPFSEPNRVDQCLRAHARSLIPLRISFSLTAANPRCSPSRRFTPMPYRLRGVTSIFRFAAARWLRLHRSIHHITKLPSADLLRHL